MYPKTLMTILILTMLVAVAGCAAPTPAPGGAEPSAARSDLQRVADPQVDPADLAALVAGNNAFAFDLYRQIAQTDGNLFYSPYSISLALAMLQAGAEGETLDEINAALGFSLPKDRLHPAFNALDHALAERAGQVAGEGDEPFQLNIANSIWGQNGYPIHESYLDVLAENYGAGMRLIDFASDPEGARQVINDWVEEETEQRIQDLIPEGSINELTRLVLANAIYFNAAWLEPFNADNTRPEPFHLPDGSSAEVPMMHRAGNMGYARGEDYQLVELPYVSPSLVMDLILPEERKLGEFEASLSGESAAQMLAEVGYTQVILGLPKFEYETSLGLRPALEALGMSQSFDPDLANFDGIAADSELYVQDALHKAFVAVDEAGTEAAAATAILMGTTSMPLEEIEITFDRPFLFLIRDRESGAILFVGRVMQP
ncbi:MAG TPA: serpin family protein [Anaerolineaceae bacterium]|nr:serpin family protein [Anaerolineaceae bacterium]